MSNTSDELQGRLLDTHAFLTEWLKENREHRAYINIRDLRNQIGTALILEGMPHDF